MLAHAASLLTHLAGGAAAHGVILAGEARSKAPSIKLRERRIATLLGAPVPLAEAARVLAALGFEMSAASDDERDGPAVEVTPPSHRPDIGGEADLIEEVMRVRGIAAIPATLPAIKPQTPRATLAVEQRVRRAAIEVGLSEALAMSFASPRQIAALGLPPAHIALQNPLGEERGVMRTSTPAGPLLDSLLRARRHARVHRRAALPARRALPRAPRGGDGPDARLPVEARSFAAVVTGKRDAVLTKPEDVDVYDAKGLAVAIATRVTLRPVTVRHQPVERRAPYLHPRAAGELLVEGAAVGVFGLLHPDVGDLFEIEPQVVVVEIDVDALEAIGRRMPQYKPIPTLPAATRDLALVVAEEVTAGAIEDEIRASGGALCESVDLFDLFAGQGIPEGHRSLAFHVVYRDPKAATDPEKARTLTDAEIDKQHAAVVAAVSKRFGAELRT